MAVVGASADSAKRGHQILRALDRTGYCGAVHAVNPLGGRILDRPVLPSVADLPEGVDLAVLCTPAATAPSLVRACGRKGVGAAVVLAVGFGESGPEGERLEAELRAAGRTGGVRIVGPNTSGLMNLHVGLNLIGARGVRRGGIALVVQSGNIALALMNEITARTADGVSICCGLGNRADVGFGEVLAYLGEHEPTRAVVVHAEGLGDGRDFLRAASTAAQRKPVIVIKGGRTSGGAVAARSHTGALAGPSDRLRAGMKQAGIIEVVRTDELAAVAATLALQPAWQGSASGRAAADRPWDAADRCSDDDSCSRTDGDRPRGPALGPDPCPGVAILSDGGGQSVLAVDALSRLDAPMAVLSPPTQTALRRTLGPAAAVGNPVDVAGAADADPRAFSNAVGLLAPDPAVALVLVVGLFGGYGIRFLDRLTATETEAARDMATTMRADGKGLVVHSIYASRTSAPLQALREAQVPVIESLEAACRAAAELERRGRVARPRWPPHGSRAEPRPAKGTRRAGGAKSPSPMESPRSVKVAGPGWESPHPRRDRHRTIKAARAEGRVALTELEAREVLADAGVTFEPVRIARSVSEAAAAAANAGRPVAMKVLSKHVLHKSDAGGVVLDVTDAAQARRAFDRIARAVGEYARDRGLAEEPCRVLVSPMLPVPVVELLVGACRDPQLGPVLTVGAGGVWTEVLADVAHRVLPVPDGEIATMLRELKASPVLAGARGKPAACVDAIVEVAAAVAQCIRTHRDISEVEINPLFAYPHKVVPVDARVVLVPEDAPATVATPP